MRAQVSKNSSEGKILETLFQKQAQRCGLLAIKNHLTARFIGKGKPPLIVKSNLDFALFNRLGRVAYMDCKSFVEDHFTHSKINPTQIDRAVLYNDWFVQAGFIVWFRSVNKVSFFSGWQLQQQGPGSRYNPADGKELGTFENFDLKLLF